MSDPFANLKPPTQTRLEEVLEAGELRRENIAIAEQLFLTKRRWMNFKLACFCGLGFGGTYSVLALTGQAPWYAYLIGLGVGEASGVAIGILGWGRLRTALFITPVWLVFTLLTHGWWRFNAGSTIFFVFSVAFWVLWAMLAGLWNEKFDDDHLTISSSQRY